MLFCFCLSCFVFCFGFCLLIILVFLFLSWVCLVYSSCLLTFVLLISTILLTYLKLYYLPFNTCKLYIRMLHKHECLEFNKCCATIVLKRLHCCQCLHKTRKLPVTFWLLQRDRTMNGESPPTITMALINPQASPLPSESKMSATQQLSISV